MASPFVIALEPTERERLEHLAASRTAPCGQVQRATALLAAADGLSNAAIGRQLHRHVDTIRAWRRRFATERLDALTDRPRPLGRPRLSPADRLRIIAAATSTPPGTDTVWTHRLLAEYLADMTVSDSQIGRILRGADLKPHLVRGWLTRPADPEFFGKAAEVCALYRACPPNAVVLSVDEKTGITARSRKHPDTPARPGRRARREFEYVRHGTASIIAALNVHTGQVLTETIARNDSTTFIRFLRLLDSAIATGQELHLVIDNGSSHTSKKTRAWLAAHPRFHVHHTPKHASWLNQVEIFFSTLTRRLLRRGQFASRDELADRIDEFVLGYDETDAKPYRWTYDGTPLKAT
ncbi:IS630 family transposase [Streptomyces violaceusniger]|uniref:IS630 family transposase n=1 Tax=Streptomyces violaceusniger TaxID=68280 RepID=UPI000D1B6DEE|nr:IS630 family transposase [Streptomyces hygroscopicus]